MRLLPSYHTKLKLQASSSEIFLQNSRGIEDKDIPELDTVKLFNVTGVEACPRPSYAGRKLDEDTFVLEISKYLSENLPKNLEFIDTRHGHAVPFLPHSQEFIGYNPINPDICVLARERPFHCLSFAYFVVKVKYNISGECSRLDAVKEIVSDSTKILQAARLFGRTCIYGLVSDTNSLVFTKSYYQNAKLIIERSSRYLFEQPDTFQKLASFMAAAFATLPMMPLYISCNRNATLISETVALEDDRAASLEGATENLPFEGATEILLPVQKRQKTQNEALSKSYPLLSSADK